MDGHCICGDIRYRLARAPLFTHCCHCRWCQRETGSAFSLNALIETASLELQSGMPEIVDTPTASGNGQLIHRCPTCRVASWSTYLGLGAAISFVRVGTLEYPDACPPDIHIFTESRQPWVRLPDDVPVTGQYYRWR